MQRKVRDLALFNLAIDSKLRGCDVVSLKREDVAPHGYTIERATIRQKKTGRPVRFEITEQTRQAVDEYLRLTKGSPRASYLAAAAVRSGASQHDNMRGSSRPGLPWWAWTRVCSVRIPCAARRRR